MSTRRKIIFGILGAYILGMILIVLAFGATRPDNPEFKPQNEFKLYPGSTCRARWTSTRACSTS